MKKKNTVLATLVLSLAALAGAWMLSTGPRAEMVIAIGSYLDPLGFVSVPVTTNTVAAGTSAEMVIAKGSYMDPMGFLSVPVTTSTIAAGTSGTQAA